MPPFGPISRRKLIRAFRDLGFTGPYQGTNHDFMRRGDRTVRLPNPHQGDISKQLLGLILKQAGVSRSEWEGV